MTKIIDNVKDLYLKFKNSSKEARYKAVLRSSVVLAGLMRYLVLITIGYIILYPLLYMLSSAFRSRDSFFDPTTIWITADMTFENFQDAFKIMKFGSALVNTFVFEIVSAAIQIISCSLVAYGLARFDFKEKKILTMFMFILILVPSQMMMIPIVTTYTKLDFLGVLGLIYEWTGYDLRVNILNTVWTYYLPALLGVGIRAGIIIYIYVQFFKGLPRELEEAAWIDGAGPLKTYIRIALPSSGVVIMTVTVFSIIWHWNDYYLSSMYLYSESWPLAVRLSEITSGSALGTLRLTFGSNPEAIGIVMAGCALFVLPVLVMYMILQKNFVKSIDRVGITG